MFSRFRLGLLLFSVSCLCCTGQAANAQPVSYQITDLGAFDLLSPLTNGKLNLDINNSGQVVMGNYLWTPLTRNGTVGNKVALPVFPGATFAGGFSINNNGWIVGFCRFTDSNGASLRDQAFLWRPNTPNGTTGTIQAIDPPGNPYSLAYGINDAGWVVGYSTAIPGSGGFLWTANGGMQAIAGQDTVWSFTINNAGIIGGASSSVPSLWTSRNARTSLTAPGYSEGFVNSLNDAGQSVGFMFNGNQYQQYDSPGFLWENGTATYITNFAPVDVNNFGQVVGTNSIYHPLLWSRAAGLRDLYSLTGGSYTHAINDYGQIVISSGMGAFLLTPSVGNGVAVTGTISLENYVGSPQPLTFTFRPTNGGAAFSRTVTGAGNFSLFDVPRQGYTVHIKADKWLAKNVSVDTTNGNVSSVTVTLKAGDANNDNFADISNLLLLIGHYNKVAPDIDYFDAADFNGDGANDITDLLLLIGNYNQQGDS